jgi:predicted secreted protein
MVTGAVLMHYADRAAWWAMILGVYAIVWFLAFLMLLPIGLPYDDDPPGQSGPGAAPAAPPVPALSMRAKILWSTVAATVVWLICGGLVLAGVIRI